MGRKRMMAKNEKVNKIAIEEREEEENKRKDS